MLYRLDNQHYRMELKRVINNLSPERGLIPLVRADSEIPKALGIYAIYIDTADALPFSFEKELMQRNTNILYIGISKVNLKSRLVDQDLRGRSNSTFFRGIGAALGYRPPTGSLIGKTNQRNYKFNVEDRDNIVDWIQHHLLVRWSFCNPNELKEMEKALIRLFQPLFNSTHNPQPFEPLKCLRAECRRIGMRRS